MAENKPERSLWLDAYNVLSDLVSCLVFVTILFVFAIRLVGVDGQSMYPTLQDGDRLTLLSNFVYRPEVGDIVVLKAPGFEQGPLVKRVIAQAGEWVDIDEFGNVYINNVYQRPDYPI